MVLIDESLCIFISAILVVKNFPILSLWWRNTLADQIPSQIRSGIEEQTTCFLCRIQALIPALSLITDLISSRGHQIEMAQIQMRRQWLVQAYISCPKAMIMSVLLTYLFIDIHVIHFINSFSTMTNQHRLTIYMSYLCDNMCVNLNLFVGILYIMTANKHKLFWA